MSRARRYAPVVLAALVLLAGCGSTTTGTDTATESPAPTATETATATPTPGPTPETVEYPAGLGPDGYANTTRALATFRGGLASGPAYTVRMDVSVGDTTQTLRARTDPDRERVFAATDRGGDPSVELYYENGTQYVRDVESDPDRYGATNATFEGAILGLNGGQFLTVITQLTLSAESVTREGDRTVITYDVTGARERADAESASGRIRVTTDGRLLTVEYEVVTGDGRRLDVSWRRTDVGNTTVATPDWVGQLRG